MAKFTVVLERISDALGLDMGKVEEEKDVIVEREIESKPVEDNQIELKVENQKMNFKKPAIEEDDCTLIVNGKENTLFNNKEKKEERAAKLEAEEKQKNNDSIERSRKRLFAIQETRQETKVENKSENAEAEKNQTKRGDSTMTNQESQKLNVYVARPTEFSSEVCKDICSNLRSGKIVTISYEDVKNNEEKCRIYDFVCGCCMALDCKVDKISREAFLLTPYNAKIYKMNEKEEAEETSTYAFGKQSNY